MQYEFKEELFSYPTRAVMVRSYLTCSISPDHKFLVCGTQAGDALVFSVDSLCLRGIFAGAGNGIWSVEFMDGAILTGGGDGTLRRFVGSDTEWSVANELHLTGGVKTISLSGDKKSAVVGTSVGILYRLDLEQFVAEEISDSHTCQINDVAFGERSDVFATASESGQIVVWDISDYVTISQAQGPAAAKCVVFDSASSVIGGFANGDFRSFDCNSARVLWTVANAHKGAVGCVRLTDSFILTAGQDGYLRFWSRTSRMFVSQVTAHYRNVASVVQDVRDPQIFNSVGQDKSLITYSAKSNAQIGNRMIQNGTFTSMCQRIDGEFEVLTTTSDGHIVIWDTDLPEPVYAIQNKDRLALNTISLSPDGSMFAAGGDNQEVTVYRISGETYELMATCEGHSGRVLSIAWTPDQKQVVSVGEE
eukprot:778167_1